MEDKMLLLEYIDELVHQYELTFQEYKLLLEMLKDENCTMELLHRKSVEIC